MKFHEAIDLIWDGKKSRGEASRKSSPDSRFTIRWDEAVHENVLCNSRGPFWENTFILDVDDLIETDWIVEKDGVVYEEYCTIDESHTKHINILKSALKDADAIAIIKDRVHEQDKPAELEEETEPSDDERDHIISLLSKRYGELEEFRRSILDGDWLEKKMLCFMQRCEMPVLTPLRMIDLDSKCANEDCPFCFPASKDEGKDEAWAKEYLSHHENDEQLKLCKKFKEENDMRVQDKSKPAVTFDILEALRSHHIPDVGKMVENDHSEDVREKVTVDGLKLGLHIDRALRMAWNAGWNAGNENKKENNGAPSYTQKLCAFSIPGFDALISSISKRIEYLVSLQEEDK